MIRLEEDLKAVNKKIKFSDLEKEHIINNLSNLFDLAIKKNNELKSTPIIRLVFSDKNKEDEIPISCLEVYTYFLTTVYPIGNIVKVKYDSNKNQVIVFYNVTEYNNQIETYKNIAYSENRVGERIDIWKYKDRLFFRNKNFKRIYGKSR